MALESNAKRTEHAGAKNMGQDKPTKRAALKAASRKIRRRAGKELTSAEVMDRAAVKYERALRRLADR